MTLSYEDPCIIILEFIKVITNIKHFIIGSSQKGHHIVHRMRNKNRYFSTTAGKIWNFFLLITQPQLQVERKGELQNLFL